MGSQSASAPSQLCDLGQVTYSLSLVALIGEGGVQTPPGAL